MALPQKLVDTGGGNVTNLFFKNRWGHNLTNKFCTLTILTFCYRLKGGYTQAVSPDFLQQRKCLSVKEGYYDLVKYIWNIWDGSVYLTYYRLKMYRKSCFLFIIFIQYLNGIQTFSNSIGLELLMQLCIIQWENFAAVLNFFGWKMRYRHGWRYLSDISNFV